MKPYTRKSRKGWWFKSRDYSRPKGKQWVVRRGGETYEQAVIAQSAFDDKERLIRLGLADRRQVVIAENSRRSIDDVIDEYEHHLKNKSRSPSHVKEVIRLVRGIIKAIGARCLNDIDTKPVEEFLDDVIDKGKSHRTRNAYRDRLHAFMGFAVRRRMLATNPIAEIEKLSEREDRRERSRALDFEEFERLLEKTTNAERRLYYLLAGRTGLRWSEIRRLTWADVDLKGGWIRLQAQNTKAGRADEVPLNDRLREELRLSRPADVLLKEKVFRTAPTLRTFQNDLARAGIVYTNEHGQVDRKSLRMMFCTHLAVKKVPFSTAVKLMRHSDPRLTSRIYTDARLLDLQGATNSLDENSQAQPTTPPDATAS